jgi:hypothetical protein
MARWQAVALPAAYRDRRRRSKAHRAGWAGAVAPRVHRSCGGRGPLRTGSERVTVRDDDGSYHDAIAAAGEIW